MKLLRWTLAGASAYVIYKYTIGHKAAGGQKAAGEDVFVTPGGEERESAAPPKRKTPR